jgi:hypothetical protein
MMANCILCVLLVFDLAHSHLPTYWALLPTTMGHGCSDHDASRAMRPLEAKELSIHVLETNERTATRPEWVV